MRKLSLKLKLTLWTVAFAAILTGAALALILVSTNAVLMRDAWAKVEDAARDAADEAELEPDGTLEIDDDIVYRVGGVSVLILDADGYLLSGSTPSSFSYSGGAKVGERRIVNGWMMLDYPGETGLVIRSIYSMSDIHSTMRQLILAGVLSYAALLIVMILGGYHISRRAFKPVSELNELALSIESGSDLSKRIPMPEANDEIAALAMNFNAMFARLESLFEAERRFTADASHELRTPISAISAQCEWALAQSETQGISKEALLAISEQTERMTRLINQLLTLARADSGKLVIMPESVNVGELCASISEELSELARANNVKLTVDAPDGVVVNADITMLMRVLVNLVDNAIRYMKPEGGNVKISVVEGDNGVDISVSDDGIGISNAALAHIWERFYRADASRTGGRSAGLGLAMVSSIASLNGWRVEAQSELDKGSCFTLHMPK